MLKFQFINANNLLSARSSIEIEVEFLQPATLVVKATQYDNPDRYAVTTLTITRGGIFDSDLQFLQSRAAPHSRCPGPHRLG